MIMKAKPSLKGLDKFLDGANDANHRKDEPAHGKPDQTVQKLFRLRRDTANRLKMAATRQSLEQYRRVTETEIIEDLIQRYIDSLSG